MRAALIDAAAHLLAAEGPGALSARRLAAEVGTSTMAIYTHFGGMTALHAAVRREGFSRLTAAFDGAATSVDPVTALAAGCLACLDAAAREPELTWALFNHRPPEGDDAGAELFRILLRRVEDGVRSGRFPDAEQSRVGAWAGQVWAAMHGITVLALSETLDLAAARSTLADMLCRLAIGYGDDPVRARRSVSAAT